MRWQVKFVQAITLDFGEVVTFQTDTWSDIKPKWMCDATIKGISQLVSMGVVFSVMDPSGTVWESTHEKFPRVIAEAYRQLMMFKVNV